MNAVSASGSSSAFALSAVAPPAFSAAVPSESVPSRKNTVPVALSGVTVAVSVTAWPKREGFGVEPSAVLDESTNTDCAIVGDEPAWKLALPE